MLLCFSVCRAVNLQLLVIGGHTSQNYWFLRHIILCAVCKKVAFLIIEKRIIKIDFVQCVLLENPCCILACMYPDMREKCVVLCVWLGNIGTNTLSPLPPSRILPLFRRCLLHIGSRYVYKDGGQNMHAITATAKPYNLMLLYESLEFKCGHSHKQYAHYVLLVCALKCKHETRYSVRSSQVYFSPDMNELWDSAHPLKHSIPNISY